MRSGLPTPSYTVQPFPYLLLCLAASVFAGTLASSDIEHAGNCSSTCEPDDGSMLAIAEAMSSSMLQKDSRKSRQLQASADMLLADSHSDLSFLTTEGAHMVRARILARQNLSATLSLGEDTRSDGCDYPGKVTLWWPTGIFSNREFKDYGEECDVPCVELATTTQCGGADGIVYHMPQTSAQDQHKTRQMSVAFSMESTANYPQQNPEQLSGMGYAVSTTHPASAVQILYFDANSWEKLLSDGFNEMPGWETRAPAVAFVASNCVGSRAALVSAFAEAATKLGFEVHSLGSCAPSGTKNMFKQENKAASKKSLLLPYLGYLSFENSLEPGYITEKVFDGYNAGSINIYSGAPDVSKHLPPESFIELQDDTIKDAARRMYDVILDESKWKQMMAWRDMPMKNWENGGFMKRWGGGWMAHSSCRMCRATCAQVGHPACEGKVFDPLTQSLVAKPS